MSNAAEDQYRAELEAQGVEIEGEQAQEESTEVEESQEEESEETSEEESQELEEEPKDKKRSIYHDLKDTKRDLKTEKEAREKAEKERDELVEKLKALDNAGTQQEQTEARDEVEEFLARHNEWNKDAVRELMEMTRKGITPQLPEDLAKELAEFRTWKSGHQEQIERDLFEKDFKASLPALKEIFPKASSEEFDAIKAELDKLAHTPEFHDKDLDYIAFKHKETLGALVSPKKRGMESNQKREGGETSYEFDPTADLASMTPDERVKWEAEYQNLSKNTGLLTDGQGRKILT